MDETKRYITKIARVALRYTSSRLKGFNLGTSEFECLHYIRKNSGISQEKLRNILNIDKASVARIAANLEKKGYICRLQDENDKRAKKLFVTDKTNAIKHLSSSAESFFYEWLIEDIPENEKEVFLKVLNELYLKSKKERRENFASINKREVMYYDEAKD